LLYALPTKMKINITHIDTACILLDINGYKILTDPTLDNAGGVYHHGFGSISRKTGTPSLNPVALMDVDLVLLSHHQHKDNFDIKGKAFASNVSKIISTKQASKALRNVVGLNNWETHHIQTNKCTNLRITATPAQHHPSWVPSFFAGQVIGFIIEFDEQKDGVIYISGDTVYFKGIEQVASRYKVNIGVFHVGSAQFRYLTGFAQYTMDSNDLLKAVSVLNPNQIIPIHHKGWSHFKESEITLTRTLKESELTKTRTIFLISGQPITIDL
jgi:L-ascorbate metabolism protein UlaG (beta-lactamase superfamily)